MSPPGSEALAAAGRLRLQLGAAVRSALTGFTGQVSLIIRNNPRGSADELLARPDVLKGLADGLGTAHRAVLAMVARAWAGTGAADDDPVLAALMSDVDRAYAEAPARLHAAIRAAHASVPPREFEPGVSRPGAAPALEAAAERAAAVSAAIRDQADALSLRGRLTLSVAAGSGITASVLAEGLGRQAAGERLEKRWVSSMDSRTCMWCRALHGMTVPLGAQFPVGAPVALPHARTRRVATPAGERRYHLGIGDPIIYTHPPKAYLGMLLGPPRHPNCRCRLELVQAAPGPPGPMGPTTPAGPAPAVTVAGPAAPPPVTPSAAPQPPAYIHAAEIRAMPLGQFAGLDAFLRAALHELNQMLRRLLGLA